MQWVLAADAAAGLAATLLLLLQVVLVAGVVADAAQGRISSASTGVLVALAAVIAGRGRRWPRWSRPADAGRPRP